MNNVATKVRIIYNENNIDSVLATTLMVSSIREVWMLEDRLDTHLSLVPYDYVHHTVEKGEIDLLIIIGVEMLGSDLLDEYQASSANKIIQFNYKKSAGGFKTDNPFQYLEITPTSHIEQPADTKNEVFDVEEVVDSSMAVLVAEYLKTPTRTPAWFTEEVKKLISIVSHYTNLKYFTNYFDFGNESDKTAMTARSLAYLYYQLPAIRKAEAERSILVLNDDKQFEYRKEDIANYSVVPKKIIKRGLSHVLYHYKGKQLSVPTLNVGEENAFDVMRQLSFPYEIVITYEDVRNHRIWRIFTAKEDQRILQFLRGLLEPSEQWVSGKIHYLVTALPKYDDKLSFI
jgi:hypothetical protein